MILNTILYTNDEMCMNHQGKVERAELFIDAIGIKDYITEYSHGCDYINTTVKWKWTILYDGGQNFWIIYLPMSIQEMTVKCNAHPI